MFALFLVVGLAGTGLSACGSDSAEPADTTLATSGETGSGAEGDVKKVAYLINGSLGDKGFYDAGHAGIEAIQSKYRAESRTIESGFDASKYEANLKAAVEYADVIFVISYGFEDQLKAVADANPAKVIVNLDTVVENEKKSITSVDFVEEESAYLAGVTAGLTTLDTSIKGVNPDKVVGVVGGDKDPVTDSFLFAYENGAKSVDPAITVERKYLGGAWDDQAKGKAAALQLFDAKADVVFQVAAGAGLGVLQAAQERGLYGIGVDTNQNDLYPGHVIASDLKNMATSIEAIYATVADGSFTKGVTLTQGLKEGGVDVIFEASTAVLPAAITDRVAAIRAEIVAGTLKVQRYKAA
jgi:basic membrane protein A and related proteins